MWFTYQVTVHLIYVGDFAHHFSRILASTVLTNPESWSIASNGILIVVLQVDKLKGISIPAFDVLNLSPLFEKGTVRVRKARSSQYDD